MRKTSNETLLKSDLPDPESGWEALSQFALSYDGYSRFIDPNDATPDPKIAFASCSILANKVWTAFEVDESLPDSLDDLRTCLFFEQRRSRRDVLNPEYEKMHEHYMWKIIQKIGKVLEASQ